MDEWTDEQRDGQPAGQIDGGGVTTTTTTHTCTCTCIMYTALPQVTLTVTTVATAMDSSTCTSPFPASSPKLNVSFENLTVTPAEEA